MNISKTMEVALGIDTHLDIQVGVLVKVSGQLIATLAVENQATGYINRSIEQVMMALALMMLGWCKYFLPMRLPFLRLIAFIEAGLGFRESLTQPMLRVQLSRFCPTSPLLLLKPTRIQLRQ